MTVMTDRNVLGGELETCGTEPLTGFYRDGCCNTGEEDLGNHTVCAVVSAEFLAHQRAVGNDLVTPRPELGFAGLQPGDRWCVCAARWREAYEAGVAPPVVLAATHARALVEVPLEMLAEHAVDVPDDPGAPVVSPGGGWRRAPGCPRPSRSRPGRTRRCRSCRCRTAASAGRHRG
jgi:uncharacterized protein (DUF2237 family)